MKNFWQLSLSAYTIVFFNILFGASTSLAESSTARIVTDVPLLNRPTQISAGVQHTCALTADGARCWGANSTGQSDVPDDLELTQISAGGLKTCGSTADRIRCWGTSGIF